MEDQAKSFGFEYLAGKALFDPAFAQELLQDPARALEGIGIEPTPELLAALQNVDMNSIMAVAEAFEPGPSVEQL
ncbi:MAG: hypothetical protein GX597_16295 [Anaerolineaceae bacterium]|nr:hypothetical protein [Anaerolineaceae bacterium]